MRFVCQGDGGSYPTAQDGCRSLGRHGSCLEGHEERFSASEDGSLGDIDPENSANVQLVSDLFQVMAGRRAKVGKYKLLRSVEDGVNLWNKRWIETENYSVTVDDAKILMNRQSCQL